MQSDLVLIAGAGPTGLVLALWLTKLGVRVRIVDKADEPGTTSRAVAVQARTLELYRQIGIADRVAEAGVKVTGLNLWVAGAKATRVPVQRLGQGMSPFPYPMIYPQDVHERMLIDELATLGVQVERGMSLLRFEQSSEGVRAVLASHDGKESVCDAAYLAGCDGAHSVVREQLGTGFPGGTYSGVFYVADVDATGPAADGELHIDLEDSDFLAVFPLHGAGHARLIGPVTWDSEAKRRDVTFEDVSDRAIANLGMKVQRVNWFSTYRVHHRVATHFAQGRAFLLGDAAHVHSPVGGQGMNTGIGDAVNLAWKLAAVVKSEAPAALLDSYEMERIGFARRLVATTDRAFILVVRQGAIARFVRTRVVPRVAPFFFRFPRTRRAMFRVLSQIGIEYRGSPLSDGVAGDVHAGDRLPWIELDHGADNFESLVSLKWQVHVYGDARVDLVAACAELGLALHHFPWQSRMQRAGFSRDALYLLRPDGYVALADRAADAGRLRAYVADRGLRVREDRTAAINVGR